MNHIEKEKLIKADIASIENRVRHAFNQGYDLGYKEGKANCSEIPTGSPKYCDRSICLKNEYNNVGCEDCEVTKSQEPTTQERQAESDKFDAAFQDGYDNGYAQARFDYGQESATKNNLGVDAISRADARSLICKIDIKHRMLGMSRKVFKDLYNGMDELPSVTPQLSSELEKNSKKLEKDFGELDCISRAEMLSYQQYLHGKMSNEENHKLWEFIKALPSATPQEPKIKVLDYDEVARKLGAVDIYKASAWITLLKDLEYLGLKICEVKK